MGSHQDTDLVERALGAQYVSDQLYQACPELDIDQSVGRTEACFDIAMIVAFWAPAGPSATTGTPRPPCGPQRPGNPLAVRCTSRGSGVKPGGRVGDVITGFVIIGAIIAVGAALGARGTLTEKDQAVLSRVTFLVASPALLFTTLAQADLAQLFSINLAATVISVLATLVVYWVLDIALVRLKKAPQPTRSERIISSWTGVYVNAGNLGIPVATYVLGNPAYMAPALLLQLLILQPIALGLLDRDRALSTGGSMGLGHLVALPFTNPMTLGSGLGVVVAATQLELPTWLSEPISMVGDMAVPAMLLAFGISLVYGPKVGSSSSKARGLLATCCKLFIQPLTAFAAATALGGGPETVFAATVTAALPSAQNLFVIASRYQAAVNLVRDTVLITTFGSVPVIFVVSLLLR